MTKGEAVSAAMVARFEGISQANGYNTDIQAIYPNGEKVPDNTPHPYITINVDTDRAEDIKGYTVKRHRAYVIEIVFDRYAKQPDLLAAHFDMLRSLAVGLVTQDHRDFPAQVVEEEMTVLPAGTGGVTKARIQSTLTVRYVETYTPVRTTPQRTA
jgi:hypothetical protein